MAGLYTHNTRAGSISESEYNSDHTNHITNAIPGRFDDYSVSVAEMQTQTDPGEVGTESLATTIAAELERVRFVLSEMKGTTNWYETKSMAFASGTVLVFLQAAAPSGWSFLASMADKQFRTATIVTNGGVAGGTWVISGLSATHHHSFTAAGTVAQQTLSNGSPYWVSLTAGVSFANATHLHSFSFTASTADAAMTVTSTGAWRPLYIDSLPCKRTG